MTRVIGDDLTGLVQLAAMPSGMGFSNLIGLDRGGEVWRFDNVRRGWYPLPMVIIEPPPPKEPKAEGTPRRRGRTRPRPIPT